MTQQINEKNEDVNFICRFHPTEWFHETGCSHMEWTKEQLQSAIITHKKSDKIKDDLIKELMDKIESVDKLWKDNIKQQIESLRGAGIDGAEDWNDALEQTVKKLEALIKEQ